MKTISFQVSGDPKGQPRPRAFARRMGAKFVARVYDAGTAEEWKSLIATAAKPFAPREPLGCAFYVQLHFIFRRPAHHYRGGKFSAELKASAPLFHTAKPDADNLAKAVLDCLTQLGCFWRDDQQVTQLYVSKSYGVMPGVHVQIKELSP